MEKNRSGREFGYKLLKPFVITYFKLKYKPTVIGSENILNYMIQNVDSKKRNTGLEFKLRNL